MSIINTVAALNVNLVKVYSLNGVLVRNKIYYRGGLQRTETDDEFITNILNSSDIINSSKVFIESDFPSFQYYNAFHIRNNKIYFFGGRQSQWTIENEPIFGKYDFQNHNWKLFESSFNLEDYSCAMTYDGLFVIFGGKFRNKDYSKDIYITNTNSDNWGNHWIKPNFTYGPRSRTFHSATILSDGRMVVLGGRTNDSILVPMSEIWVYNINLNEWQLIMAKGDIPSPRSAHSAILTSDNKIIIYGGTSDSDVNLSQPLAVLDTSVWVWLQPKIISSIERNFHTNNIAGKQLMITFENKPTVDPLNDITILNITTWAIDTTFKSESLSIDEKMLPLKTLDKRDIVDENNNSSNDSAKMIIVITSGVAIILVGTIIYCLYLCCIHKKKSRKQKRNIQTKRRTAADHIEMILGYFGKSFEKETVPTEVELDSIIVPESNYAQSIDESGTGTPLSSISSLLSPNHLQIPKVTRHPKSLRKPISIPQPIMELPSRTESSLSFPASLTPTQHSTSSEASQKQSQFIKDDGLIIRPRQIHRINSRTLMNTKNDS
ncbi:10319_t:CDS:2 [Gigaspora margarita]|uniref:10319_t:CDS:1 n=1 Tax=Gigaspora margarita TaxID=4874 RepID=A0ABN7VEX3_GIGMA|nr:10319_t:CDS:2 [Gigaspora margarita]